MEFKEFATKLKGVLGGKSSASAFTRTLFETLIDDEVEEDILESYSDDTFKAYYSGNTGISGIAKKISPYLDQTRFVEYINNFPDGTRDILCETFKDSLLNINPFDIGDALASLFVEIITQSVTKKRDTSKGAPKNDIRHITPIIYDINGKAPDLEAFEDGVFYIERKDEEVQDKNPFNKYIEQADSYYSTKKTLLYAEKPHPFYEIYVPSDIELNKKYKFIPVEESSKKITIHDATVDKLSEYAKYIIIEGIGGIGKSMFLTHLFLSSSLMIKNTGIIPVLLSLQEYNEHTSSILDFISAGIKDFDPTISQSCVIEALQSKKLLLLFDGLDEIQTSSKKSFETDLNAFIKSYPDNMIIITSRPINSFVSYS